MMKRCVLVVALFGVVTVGAAESKAKSELVASLELASFADVQQKVTTLGTMINNPIVPMMLLTTGQQQLIKQYGQMRANAPFTWMVYASAPSKEAKAVADDFETVLVYPSADRPATMLMKHPGATKDADGTLHLLANEDNPEDRFVAFTADGMFCAYAESAAFARRAIADFARVQTARRQRAEKSLLRATVESNGLALIAAWQEHIAQEQAASSKASSKEGSLQGFLALQEAQQKRQMEKLLNFASIELSLDLNEKGLDLNGCARAKPGVKASSAAGFGLPAGAFDMVPDGAPLFFASNPLIQSGWANEGEFRADLKVCVDLVAASVAKAKQDKDGKKYGKLLDGLLKIVQDVCAQAPYPSASDWGVGALAFGPKREPYLVVAGEQAGAVQSKQISDKAMDGLVAACEEQWPGNGIMVKKADGVWTFDWSRILDLAVAESGAQDAKKEIAQAKKTVAAVLGGPASELSYGCQGTRVFSRFAPVGFVPPAPVKKSGEARFAAALPESAKDRPACAFYLSLYSMAREAVLPIMASTVNKKDADQWKAMIQSMAPAAPNSALVGAAWLRKDGSLSGVLRITADELKNFGAAFNAFTAASMSSALGDE